MAPLPGLSVTLMSRLFAGLLALFVSTGPAAAGEWKPEAGVAAPSYADVDPIRSDLNIDFVVLSCEQGPNRRGLQLRLYLSDDGPLALADGSLVEDDPTVDLIVDGTKHRLQPLFADDYVVLADAADGTLPLLSGSLLDALQAGRHLELRISRGLVELPAGRGEQAIAAVRRCADGWDGRHAETAAHRL